MNVQELIHFLELFPPDKEIYINAGNDKYFTILDTMAYDKHPILCVMEFGK